ncbi:MAG: TetR/AcrR family transcriptional regulator [Candidatus Marinimicrobia bacterium]|nr:TetR/AcrR family transcriptional regulator [Candidatus Neomarinimicrobiota bacterium]
MNNKQIQEQRMRTYFLQATREILRSEGLKNISVRNVADRAGYSYATLYNYFKDVKDLVFECVLDFQQECREFISDEVKNMKPGRERLVQINRAYFKYFVQYPGIFELFYIEKTTDLAHRQPTIEKIDTFLPSLMEEDWEVMIQEKVIEPEGAALLQEQIRFFIVGVLISYINRRYVADYPEVMAMVDQHLNYMLNM